MNNNLWNLLPKELKFLQTHSSYIVGGAIRNLLLNEPIKDIDIITDKKTYEKLLDIKSFPVVQVNKRFATLRIISNPPIDITLLETSLEEDIKRRDFTMNVLTMDSTGKIIDLVNGTIDIKNKQIKAINQENLLSDPIRMLRAFRFALQLNFNIEKETLSFIINHFEDIANIPKERIKDEINKIFVLKGAASILLGMREMGILCLLFPLLKTSKNFRGGKAHGRDLLDHALITMMGVDMFEDLTKGESIALRWATLLHDIGKPETLIQKNNGTLGFYGHDNVGAEKSFKFLQEMKYSNEFSKKVARIIKMHMRPHLINSNFTDKALRRFIRDSKGNYKLVIYHALCDSWADKSDPKSMSNLYNMLDKMEEIASEKPIKRPLNGNDIMKIFNVPQSPLIGNIIRFMDEILLENPNEEKEAIIEKIKNKFFK